MSITIDGDLNTISANDIPFTFVSKAITIPSGNIQQRPQNPIQSQNGL